MVLGCKQSSNELFMKMHVRIDECQKEVQQLVDSRAQHFVVCCFKYFFKTLFFWIFANFFRIHITSSWRRDMVTIFWPIWISIRICGWRQDCPMDPIKIRCMICLTLQFSSYGWPIIFQQLDARNRFWAFKLQSLRWF
jgi:hypothetical protein